MFISVYASGTNVQRLAKCSKKIDGVVYTAYSQLESSEPGIVRRRFFATHVDALKTEVEKLNERVQPSWAKIWGRPMGNKHFIGKLLQSLCGERTERTELNLSAIADDSVDCFMLLVSANNKEMGDIRKIADRYIPDWKVVILNGDYTKNKEAEDLAEREINEARIDGKHGVIFVANQMGSRSFSVPEIQATVIAFDRGSVDATVQKVSRSLTPTNKDRKLYNQVSDKEYGYIVDLSFDPNRTENIERLILEEALQVQRSDDEIEDFTSAVKYVLSCIDLMKINEYGHPVEISESDMFDIYGNNETLLKVADIAVDVQAAVESGVFEILSNINADGKGSKSKKTVVGEDVINNVIDGKTEKDESEKKETDTELRNKMQVITAAIKALNWSATSVYYLSNIEGESYRQCVTAIEQNPELDATFEDFFGVDAQSTLLLLNKGVLNEAILDVIVQNSRPKTLDNLFL